MTATTVDQLRPLFSRQGYVVLEQVIDKQELGQLRAECDWLFNAATDDIVSELGCVLEPHEEQVNPSKFTLKEYVEYHRCDMVPKSSTLIEGILSSVSTLVQAIAGDSSTSVSFLNEQYLVKPPYAGDGSRFDWHRDSQYLPVESRTDTLISAWIALDDVNATNGPLIFEPADCTDQAPKELHVKAGTSILISGSVLHASKANVSSSFRRAYMPQYLVHGLPGDA